MKVGWSVTLGQDNAIAKMITFGFIRCWLNTALKRHGLLKGALLTSNWSHAVQRVRYSHARAHFSDVVQKDNFEVGKKATYSAASSPIRSHNELIWFAKIPSPFFLPSFLCLTSRGGCAVGSDISRLLCSSWCAVEGILNALIWRGRRHEAILSDERILMGNIYLSEGSGWFSQYKLEVLIKCETYVGHNPQNHTVFSSCCFKRSSVRPPVRFGE